MVKFETEEVGHLEVVRVNDGIEGDGEGLESGGRGGEGKGRGRREFC